jgi:hypothetical protein
MRRLIFTALLATALSSSTGCLIPLYSGDPVRRTEQLIFTSEDLRALLNEWERFWFLDQPSHMTPQRVHGGVTFRSCESAAKQKGTVPFFSL